MHFFAKKLQKYLHNSETCITFANANGKEVKRNDNQAKAKRSLNTVW